MSDAYSHFEELMSIRSGVRTLSKRLRNLEWTETLQDASADLDLFEAKLSEEIGFARAALTPEDKPKRPSSKRKMPSTEELRAYAEATERARSSEGFLQCEKCGRSMRDGQEHRHHKTFRTRQGGKTVTENILVVCQRCHDEKHGIKHGGER